MGYYPVFHPEKFLNPKLEVRKLKSKKVGGFNKTIYLYPRMMVNSDYHNFKARIMAQSDLTISLDNQIKTKFESLCEQLGMSVNTAINVFMKAAVRHGGIPFPLEINVDDPVKRRAIAAFRQARRIAESNPGPEMTLEEINEEIRAARRERAQAKKL
jgi:addiction module RelB/DinJ family antitoxin